MCLLLVVGFWVGAELTPMILVGPAQVAVPFLFLSVSSGSQWLLLGLDFSVRDHHLVLELDKGVLNGCGDGGEGQVCFE